MILFIAVESWTLWSPAFLCVCIFACMYVSATLCLCWYLRTEEDEIGIIDDWTAMWVLVRVSLCSPGWSVPSVPQLQEMLLPLLAKFWVCATFLFYFSFSSLSPSSPPPSSLLLPLLFFLLFLMLFFLKPGLPWHLLCRWGWPNLPTQIHLPRITGVGHHTQIFFLKRFIFVCVCVCIMWVQVVSEARREC